MLKTFASLHQSSVVQSPTGAVRRNCKMCFVVQNHLGKGARCAPPLHPPGRGSVRGLTPSRANRTYRRSITRGRLRSPCTHRSFQEDQGLSRPLKPTRTVWPLHHQSGERSCSPDTPMTTSWRPTFRSLDARHFMETTSSRPGREHFIAILALEPSHRPRSLRAPWNPDQSSADWMPPSRRRWITIRGLSPPPEPSLSDFENYRPTNTEPAKLTLASRASRQMRASAPCG